MNGEIKLLTATDLGVKLGIPRSTIYRMAKLKLIPVVVVGPKQGGVRFIEEEVLQSLRRPAVMAKGC